MNYDIKYFKTKAKTKTPIDSLKWCRYLVIFGHITATLSILAHVIWYFAAREVLAWPADVYLRYWIIYPAIGFLVLNTCAEMCVRSDRLPLVVKEYCSLSPFFIFSVYLSLTHDIAKVLMCTYILPIFASTVFSNAKLTRRIFFMSVVAVLLPGIKLYLLGSLDSDMVMETFVACFMFLCAYLLATVLIQYGHDNIAAIVSTNEQSTKNELAFLQAQIKPHFLYNSINTIVSFCYTDGEKAANLLVELSKYLRLVFDVDRQSALVLLEQEIEVTKAYTNIQKARYGELINVEYDIDPELLSKEIPSFCIQPLVENAIKHGLLNKASGGTVNISTKKTDGAITIKITDNGIGMSEEKLDKIVNMPTAGEGIGFVNVLKRIESLLNARIDIHSAENVGTTVTITIPDALIGGAYD